MRTSGIIVIIIIALLTVLGITFGTGMMGDNNNHQNISDMLPDNLETNNIIEMNDNGTYVVIDNNTHKIIHTATRNKTIVTPKNNSKDDTIELQALEYMSVDPSDNTAPNIKIDSNNTPDKLLSPAEIIKQYDLHTDEIVTMYIYVAMIEDGNLSKPVPLYEINNPFYSLKIDATTGELFGYHSIFYDRNDFEIYGDLDNEFDNFIKSKTDVYGVQDIYYQLRGIAHQKLMEAKNLTDYDDYIYSMNITNKGNGSTYTFITDVGNVTLDSDKNVLNISVSENDTTSDNFISKEEAINIVKPGVIKDIKEFLGDDFVSRTTFNATGPQITGGFGYRAIYEVETFIDGNFFRVADIDARTGEILESIGIGDASSGIRGDGTWGPLTLEEQDKRYEMLTVARDSLDTYCQNNNLPELWIDDRGKYVNDDGEEVYQFVVYGEDFNKKCGTMEVNSVTLNVTINIDSSSIGTNETSIHVDEDVGAYLDENNQTVEDNQ